MALTPSRLVNSPYLKLMMDKVRVRIRVSVRPYRVRLKVVITCVVERVFYDYSPLFPYHNPPTYCSSCR